MSNIIKGLIYDLIIFFACKGKRIENRKEKVLLLRVDEIGDYILWRKFIFEILNSHTCFQKEVHFIGNESWKKLFYLEFDSSNFKNIYWFNKNKFKTSIIYRFKFSRMIYLENFSTVINPTYSRAKRVDDSIVKAARAKSNFGFVRNNENYLAYEQNFDKSLYNNLYEIKNKHSFEFDKNKKFAEWFCEKSINIFSINFNEETFSTAKFENLPKNYFIVFPGSRSSTRIWNTDYFIEVSNYIYKKYKLTAVICGGNGDMVYANNFINKYAHPFIDLTSKTSLPELLFIIKKASCLISVDTGSIHLAASVNCLTLGIFNGSQYGRFSPYPKEICSKIISFYPKQVREDVGKNNLSKYELICDIPYDKVTSQEVIDFLETNSIL